MAYCDDLNDFISQNNFQKIPDELITFLIQGCNEVRDSDGKLSYTEIKLLRDNDSVIDFNKHHAFLNSYQKENYDLPFYSITFWSWYKTVALKAGSFEYLSLYKQSIQRRNMVVNKQFFDNLARDKEFSIWLEQDSKNSNRFFYGKVKIKNSEKVLTCFN